MASHFTSILTILVLVASDSLQLCEELTFDQHFGDTLPPASAVADVLAEAATVTELAPIAEKLKILLTFSPKTLESLQAEPEALPGLLTAANSDDLQKVFSNQQTLKLLYDFPCLLDFLLKNKLLLDTLANNDAFLKPLLSAADYKTAVPTKINELINTGLDVNLKPVLNPDAEIVDL